jgi:hypothetical protein
LQLTANLVVLFMFFGVVSDYCLSDFVCKLAATELFRWRGRYAPSIQWMQRTAVAASKLAPRYAPSIQWMQRTAVAASKLAPPFAADPRPRYVDYQTSGQGISQ